MSYRTNDFKSGLKIMLDGSPCHIIDNEFVKPGKGQAFSRVKYRNLLTGRVGEKTFKSGESVPSADVVEAQWQFLYRDEELWHFMHPETFEQLTAQESALVDALHWLKAEDICTVILWDGAAIQILPPNFVTLQVTETDPGLRGDTASGGNKAATLETGVVIRVPLFVQEGELVKVDTRNASYVSRVKE